jgi:hypothetical protein
VQCLWTLKRQGLSQPCPQASKWTSLSSTEPWPREPKAELCPPRCEVLSQGNLSGTGMSQGTQPSCPQDLSNPLLAQTTLLPLSSMDPSPRPTSVLSCRHLSGSSWRAHHALALGSWDQEVRI